MENKYIVSYVLGSDLKSLIAVQFIAIPAFGEEGIYTKEESKKIIEVISKTKVPDFSKSLDGWVKFSNKLNKKIYKLYGK